MINLFSVKLGAFWFMDSRYAIDNERFNSNLKIISESVERSKDVSIISHLRKYSSPSLPPIWKTLEVVSLGTLSKLYSNCSDTSVKNSVAIEFDLNDFSIMKSWMECISVLRNCCAHHANMLNQSRLVKAVMPKCLPNSWITDFSFCRNSLYPKICVIAYWINSISNDRTFVVDFKQLLSKYPSVSPDLFGFLPNWEQEPLWR